MPGNDKNPVTERQLLDGTKLLITIIAAVTAILVSYYTGRSDLLDRVSTNTFRIERLQDIQTDIMERIRSHVSDGVDGISHPGGSRVLIEKLRTEFERHLKECAHLHHGILHGGDDAKDD